MLRIAILGYRNDSYGTWDPEGIKTGLPGSEECAVYASQTLAKRGHTVVLYMNPPAASSHSTPEANPRWISVAEWDNPLHSEKYDLVLMWRRYDADSGRKRGKKVFFWPHDSPFNLNVNRFPAFDGICILSQHHWSQFARFPGFSTIPYTISGNGLLLSQFEGSLQKSHPLALGYFSNYARGLLILLFLWPTIHERFPSATLDIYYGRDTWGLLSPERLAQIVHLIEEMKPLGVRECGKVGHQELAEAMKRTSIWVYPCNEFGVAETFCITAVKCQAAGCIPVTTRIGALAETVHPEAPSIPLINTPLDIFAYRDLLLETMQDVIDHPEAVDRQQYIDFGRRFTWDRCVDKWLQLYQEVK